jgi:hypothetical protein
VTESTEKGAGSATPALEQASARPRLAGVSTLQTSRWSRLLEWLLRTRGLTAARAEVAEPSSPAHAFRRRARLAYELAERVLDPIEPLRAGSGAALAADLFRQSAYWALCAADHAAEAVPCSQLWNAELESELARSLPDREALEAARQLLLEASFVSLAELSEDDQLQSALRARSLAATALDRIDRPQRRVETLLWQRFARLGLCALVLIAAVGVSLRGAEDLHQGTDLLAGKAWRTSSTWGKCDPVAARCGGVRTRVFFHTKEDASPWIEYDLGAPKKFSRVVVRNRTDSVPDRAIPLVLEVSDDQKVYREVVRRPTSFRTWRADFQPQRARYVRLRVARRTWLHLERISIYGAE